MNEILAPLAIASTTSTSFALASAIDAGTQVPIGPTAGVFVFIAGLIWWLARKLQAIEDKIDRLETDLAARPCQYGKNCPTTTRS